MATYFGPERPREDSLEAVRAERDFWRTLFEDLVATFPEPILVVDDAGTVTHWNEACAQLTDVPGEEAVGEPANEIAGVDETIAERAVRTESVVEADEIRSGTSAAGTQWHTRDIAVPMRDQDGEAVGAFEIASRVTDLVEQRREMEEIQRRISGEILATIEELQETAESVSENSREISDLTDDQSADMAEIADEMANLSATVEEIAASTAEVSENSREAADLATDSREDADAVLESMERIAAASDAVAENAERLREGIDEIDEIVATIDEIADRTNMLALNASIEAARAGEAGEGFAVVAEEVKSLAEESQGRAGEIERIVERIREHGEETLASIRRATEEVDDGKERVERSAENLERIADAVEAAAAGIDEVAAVTDDQASTTEDVAGMVDDATERAERVADRVERIASANEQQTAIVDEIRLAIERLEEIGAEETDADASE